MKNIIKVSLIIAAIVIAAMSLLYYAKSKVEPPSGITLVNYHAQELDRVIEKLNGGLDNKTLENTYLNIESLIRVFSSNGYIDNVTKRAAEVLFIQTYSPKFAEMSNSCFLKRWTHNDIEWIEKRINEIANYNVEFKAEHISKISQVKTVISKYKSAINTANSAKFSSSNNVRSDVQEIKNLSHDSYLKNCASLQTRLDRAVARIEAGHYATLVNMVDKLAKYAYMSSTQFNDLCVITNQEVSAYNGMASGCYGKNQHNTSNLSISIANHQASAKAFYRRNY